MMQTLYKLTDCEKVVIRDTNKDDEFNDADWFDYSGLTDYSTCLTNGILKQHLRKTFRDPNGRRQMALEAGSAAHEVFAARRVYQLKEAGLDDHFLYHGLQLFGEARFNGMLEFADDAQSFSLEALYNSGFTDDPDDKRRTTGNIEEACIIYMQSYNYEEFPVWVADRRMPTADVGIECSVDMVVEFHFADNIIKSRVIGKVDGIHTNQQGELVLNENKTAGRLDMAWQQSFSMSHQLSVYALAMTTRLKQPVELVDVYGLALPTPRSGSLGGFIRIPELRSEKHHTDFLIWLLHNRQMRDFYGDNVAYAPRSTNACNRYFSTCEFMPYCGAADYDRDDVLEQMGTNEWNPLKS